MEVPIEQQAPPQQQDVDTSSLTPEQQEEMKLRMKYPNPHKPGGSTFIQKMLHRGVSLYILFISPIFQLSYLLSFIIYRIRSISIPVTITWPNLELKQR